MKIICFEGNYLKPGDHSIESYEPVFFIKPETALLRDKNPFFIPDHTKIITPKLNIVIKICRLGKNIQEKFAHKYYDEIGIGVDLEATDVLQNCKNYGLPWEAAKAYDSSAPLGKFLSKNEFSSLNNISFSMNKNGQSFIKGNTSDLILFFDKLVAHASKYLMLKMGDYIFTGSPESLNNLQIEDRIECFIEDKKLLSFHIK
jgi:2-keto-4-pentenoate hydratase/2-oxohepta-3-ene-1,7-dioic acid hydratase in catechol pathway